MGVRRKLFFIAPNVGGRAAPQTSLLPWGGGAKVLQTPLVRKRMVRTARERENIMARNMMCNHTDIQDKHCTVVTATTLTKLKATSGVIYFVYTRYITFKMKNEKFQK